MTSASAVEYTISEPIGNHELNELFRSSWPNHQAVDFQVVLRHSMAHVCALLDGRLVGYVNAAWDGRTHAFILDTNVHPAHRRQGIGKRLVGLAVEQASAKGVTWVHVDHEPSLKAFYASCGFRSSEAGVLHLGTPRAKQVG